ncbi:hypothetical protein [Aliivibrio sifiae]|uniref:Uncharacterized protein n=1 Tax=Aliivibrio sifiae TaxID=566293 RepID=A0A2S7X0K5_9GAMM|nr:hypothetical protein [Aliivibrio sifiae]PQJ83326.1 hypothetical protein BTO22_18230 [Aliivibrio sifiae]
MKNIELVGIPCCGKSYICANKFSNIRYLSGRKNIIYELLLFICGILTLKIEDIKFFISCVRRENVSFLFKVNIFRNIVRKFGLNKIYRNRGYIIDEGVSQIPFNLLNSNVDEVFKVVFPYLESKVYFINSANDSEIKKRLINRGHTRLFFINIDDFISINRSVENNVINNLNKYLVDFEVVENA